MGKLTVSYNNNSIIDTTNDGSFTLATEGKLMADDVSVAFEGGVPLTLEVNVDTGSAVTVTNGSKTLTGTSENGKCTFTLPEAGTWTASATKDGKSSTTKTFNIETQHVANLAFVSSTLNSNDWSTIRYVSDEGLGSHYWSVGARKAVTLNGKVGQYTFSSYTAYAFIIGFNHNSEYEGDHRIHFQFGKTAATGGKDICFVDGSENSGKYGDGYFNMNGSESNDGGWDSSQMRGNVCGTSLTNYSGTFVGALPSALRAVIKSVTKFTDNAGNVTERTASAVTSTTDVVFLLSEYEVFGTVEKGNAAESAKQAQYAYYSAGNSKIKYKHSATGTAMDWWLRSPVGTNGAFARAKSSGNVGSSGAHFSAGFAPAFCV